MGNTVYVCKIGDMKNEEMKTIKFGEEDVLIANVGGQFYGVSAICPHMSGYLGKGKLTGPIIRCPVHGAEYDVRTGKIAKNIPWLMRKMTNETSDLKTYPIIVDNEEVKISF